MTRKEAEYKAIDNVLQIYLPDDYYEYLRHKLNPLIQKYTDQERNKIIDECKAVLKNQTSDCSRVITVNELLYQMELLKTQ